MSRVPLGTISRVYTNGSGETVGLIRWPKNVDGPAQIVTDVSLREGQSMRLVDGKAVVR